MIAYAIADPQYFWQCNDTYLQNLERADWVLYRDKSALNYSSRAQEFAALFQKRVPKILLHQDFKLAAHLGVWGVHLTSQQFNDITHARQAGLYTIISTHSFDEIALAQQFGANAVTFSPIFHTPHKGQPKGISLLKEAVERFKINVIALGGIIGKKEIEEVAKTEAFGFASIRYFLPDL